MLEKVRNALNDCAKPLKGSHIHILGVAYKRDIDDVRESPALDIIHLLKRYGTRVTYSAPYVSSIIVDDEPLLAVDQGTVAQADCAVIVTDHRIVDYAEIVKSAKLIVDTRNALRGIASDNIVRL